MQDNDKHESNETENSPEYTDEVTKSKIKKHLTDINDTISPQDIKNIDANIKSTDVPKTGNDETEELPPGKTDKDGDSDEDNREQLPTSWNILE